MIDSKVSRTFRGIAVLMVMVFHYANWNYEAPLSELWKGIVASWGIYGVDIFFLLSGYGLVKSYEKSGVDRGFVIRRIMNSYVPYILIVGFCTIFIDKGIDSLSDVGELLIGQDFWFMRVLFAFYIMFMVIYRIGFLKEILLGVAVLGFTYWLYASSHADFWFLSNGAFLIGVYAASLEKGFKEELKNVIVRINLAGIGLVAAIVSAYWFSCAGTVSAHMTASMLFTVMVLGLCVQLKGEGYVLKVIGVYSLYIYLLHGRLLWLTAAKMEGAGYFKIAVTAFFISLLVSMGIGYIIEKVLRLIQKR